VAESHRGCARSRQRRDREPALKTHKEPSHADLLAALARVPELAGRDLTLTPLSGGITNRNFLVKAAGTTRRHVLRLAGNDTHLLGISREVEHAATVMAAGVGVGPEVAAFLRPEGWLVTRFIEGSPVPVETLRQPAALTRLADSLRRVHAGPAIPGLFAPVKVAEVYLRLAHDRGVAPAPDAARALAIGQAMERACLADPVALAPTHNDLLNANLIDDGERIRIVDWEYAGMGDPWFDLGNVSINHELTADEEAALLTAYLGTDPTPAALARLTLMRVASDLREAAWGVLQAAISTLDVDFRAYAAEHLDRLLRNATDPAFRRALRTVGEGRTGR
jgi:thiamine kinase-like enzyme